MSKEVRKRRVLDVFGANGRLSSCFKSYKPRPGQVAMAGHVFDAIEDRGVLLVEGPTGTGKSFAYLVPAVLEASHSKSRVVIATANINLQQQIFKKDLPFVHRILLTLDNAVKYAQLKGINNYWCELAHEENRDRISDYASAQAYIEEQYGELVRQHGKGIGDKSDFDFEPDGALWSMVSTDSEGCIGQKCSHYEDCPGMRVRENARKANIVVVNYHILFADLLAGGGIIGKHDVLICDEAHEFSEIARDFFSMTLSIGVIARATKRAPRVMKKMVRDVAAAFFNDVRDEYFSNTDGTHVLTEPLRVDYEALAAQLENVRLYFSAGKNAELDPDNVARDKKDEEYVTSVIGRLTRICHLITAGQVTYIERNGDACALHSKPVDISGFVQTRFFVPRTGPTGNVFKRAIILTSATLTDGESFRLVREELGVPQGAVEYLAPTPFDLSKQCAVFIDPRLPVPAGSTRHAHMEQSSERIAQAVHIARGRTLALFTSKMGMEFAFNYVNRRLVELGNAAGELPILKQGTFAKSELITRFKADNKTSLFGLASFWTGVDVPGESLSVLIIDKIPFPTPDDPVINALQNMRGGGWEGFLKVSVPRAAIEFRQGYGRLIRGIHDRGVLMFLDPRLITKNYGAEFLKGLKGVPFHTDYAELKPVLAEMDRQRTIDVGEDKLEGDDLSLNMKSPLQTSVNIIVFTRTM